MEPTIKITRADKIVLHGPPAIRVDPANSADVNGLVVTPKSVGAFTIVALNVPCENGSVREPNNCAAIKVLVVE